MALPLSALSEMPSGRSLASSALSAAASGATGSIRAASRSDRDGQRYGLPELLARILAGRNVGLDEVEDFLDPTIRRLMPDPNALTEMEQAASRIADAVQPRKRSRSSATTTSTARRRQRCWRVLRRRRDPFFHIPDRLYEGYGPNVEAVSDARRGEPPDHRRLRHDQRGSARRSKQLGLDVVVIDHHQADGHFRRSMRSSIRTAKTISLASVILRGRARVHDLSRAGARIAPARPLECRGPSLIYCISLDLVALGTVADVVPLKGLNRAFVTKGLISMRARENHGLPALMDAARLEGPPESWHLGFLLGPRINAGGRIGDATLGTKLLITNDLAEANAIARLDQLNRERQEVEKRTLEQAEAEAYASLGHDEQGAIVIASGEGWHPGVVGLVAARLKERFSRPAFAIAIARRPGHRLGAFDRRGRYRPRGARRGGRGFCSRAAAT